MDNKDIELIQQMENKYDTFMPVLTNLIDSIEKFNLWNDGKACSKVVKRIFNEN